MPDDITTPARSSARRRLADAILQVDVAAKAQAEAAAPARRFNELIRLASVATAEAAALRHADDEALTEWLVAGEAGPRPEPAPALARAEAKAAHAERDARAAETALARTTEREARANEALRHAATDRDSKLFAVVGEEVERLRLVLTERFNSALDVDAKLAALSDAAAQLAHMRETAPLVQSGAFQLVELIAGARRAARDIEKKGSAESALRFIDRLRTAATASFGDVK